MFVYVWFLRRHSDIGGCVTLGFLRRLWKGKSILSFHMPFLRMAGEGQGEVEEKQQREKKVAGIWRVLGCSTASNCLPSCSTTTPSCTSSPTASVLQATHQGDIFTSVCAENHLQPPRWPTAAPHQRQTGVCKGELTTGWPYWPAHTSQAPSFISLHSVIFTVSKPSSQTTSSRDTVTNWCSQ